MVMTIPSERIVYRPSLIIRLLAVPVAAASAIFAAAVLWATTSTHVSDGKGWWLGFPGGGHVRDPGGVRRSVDGPAVGG